MKLDLPARPFGGYIFDCDGTIADTMPIHYRAWSQAMEDFGGTFPEDLFYQWGGMPTAVIVEEINKKFGLALDVEATVHRKERHYLENVHQVQPVMPVLEIARGMHGVKPLAIASGGHREMVEATLNAIDIIGMFDAIVCAEDYDRGKPFPDPFLLAAERIGVPPEDCLVFEDSPTGVDAAKAAGMHYVFVPSAGRPL
ncbi:MAG: HAD family hydrolase [Terrimicrobiaceae bacterium]